MKQRKINQEDLKAFRLEMGVSANIVCDSLRISKGYYSQIENMKKSCSSGRLEEIIRCIFEKSPNARLEMLFDYVRIRFKITDVKIFLEEILRMKEKYFVIDEYGHFGYERTYSFGNIRFYHSKNESMGILLELSGTGCREFESVLKAQKRDWIEFFKLVEVYDGVYKRLDLAIDDKYYLIDIPFIINKIEQDEVISVFRQFRVYKGGEIREDGDKNIGNTVYIGSSKSEVIFCIYEKDYEQYVKLGKDIEEEIVKNRFEIRLKNERSEKVIENILNGMSIEKVVLGIINRYIKVVDKNEEIDRRKWKINEKWEMFLGDIKNSLKLTSRPKEFEIERTYRWLTNQVSPTLSMVAKLDNYFGDNFIERLTNNKISKKHQSILDTMMSDIEDVII